MSDSLFDRGKALEDVFFRNKDQQLLDQLRGEMEAKDTNAALSAVSGIEDEAVLTALAENNVTAESLTSVSLIPLVAVAWADGVVQDSEREAILRAAATTGIVSGSASYQLIESWMTENPGAELFDTWKEYVGALKSSINEAAFNQLKTTIIERAKNVAQSAGGFLGVAKTSDAESKVIAELEAAFG